jgi:hypothetical protein
MPCGGVWRPVPRGLSRGFVEQVLRMSDDVTGLSAAMRGLGNSSLRTELLPLTH